MLILDAEIQQQEVGTGTSGAEALDIGAMSNLATRLSARVSAATRQ